MHPLCIFTGPFLNLYSVPGGTESRAEVDGTLSEFDIQILSSSQPHHIYAIIYI